MGNWCIAGSSPWTHSSDAPHLAPKDTISGQRKDHTEKHWQNYIKPIRNNTEAQMLNNFIASDQTVGLIWSKNHEIWSPFPWELMIEISVLQVIPSRATIWAAAFEPGT